MKHLIENLIHYILRNCRRNQLRYFFARLLAEIVKDEKTTNNVLISIANYFVKYNNGTQFQYNDIFVVGNIVYIYTLRPGYWIGKGGTEVDRLLVELNHNTKTEKTSNYEIRFIEQKDAQSIITKYIFIENQY